VIGSSNRPKAWPNVVFSVEFWTNIAVLEILPSFQQDACTIATCIHNITTLPCKMVNDDKKLSGLYKVYQSINFLSMFAILQNDVTTF